jgi:hypothetical protein
MNAFLISLSTFCLLLAGSCSTTAPPGSPPERKTWSLDYKTSGGFAGVGKGSITVSSAGEFVCSGNDRGQVVKGANGTLTPRQLQPISDAVSKLDLKGWQVPGLNVAAPDAFGYQVRVYGSGLNDFTTVQWYDNTVDKLPADLKRLSAVLEETMKARCTIGTKQ